MKHPQADLIMQVAQIHADGECEHWEYRIKTTYGVGWFDFTVDHPRNSDLYCREIRMKPSHPDYNTEKNPNRPKPVSKQIDMSNLPVGTMTNYGEIIKKSTLVAFVLNFDSLCPDVIVYCFEELRLAEQTKPTAWLGGECPVPEGCMYKWQNGYGEIFGMVQPHGWNAKDGAGRVAAYWITGVADGWTDGSL
jgi:hypothetical protein